MWRLPSGLCEYGRQFVPSRKPILDEYLTLSQIIIFSSGLSEGDSAIPIDAHGNVVLVPDRHPRSGGGTDPSESSIIGDAQARRLINDCICIFPHGHCDETQMMDFSLSTFLRCFREFYRAILQRTYEGPDFAANKSPTLLLSF